MSHSDTSLRGVTLVVPSAEEAVAVEYVLTADTPCASTDAEPLPEADVRAQLMAELEAAPCASSTEVADCPNRATCSKAGICGKGFDMTTPFVRTPKPAVAAH